MNTPKPTLLELSNPSLFVQIAPEEGGRISSLKSLDTGLEFLTESRSKNLSTHPSYAAHFQDGPCAGMEECLPTVGPCDETTIGGPVPDHGDFWQLSWEVTEQDESHIALSAMGFSRPLSFQKVVELREGAVSIRYGIRNIAKEKTSFLYACHPLFAVEMGDRIALPAEIGSLKLTYSRTGRLGKAGKLLPWSDSGLDIVSPGEAGTAEMFYSDRVTKGRCGLYRAQKQQGLLLTYPTEILPYLGLWLCYGGWPGGNSPQQYAVALEPTTAPCNTLKEAQNARKDCILLPGERLSWELKLEPTPANLSWKEFQELVKESSFNDTYR